MKLIKYYYISICVMLCLFMAGCGTDEPQLIMDSEETVIDEKTDEVYEVYEVVQVKVYVHMTGEVVNPGLYELADGSRLYDAVMLAGGFTENADTEYANLAEVLVDGKQYQIYSKDEVLNMSIQGSGESAEAHYTGDGLLDINEATNTELMTISGIGQSKADAIVEYRQQNGRFDKTEDIMNVSGIGEGLYQRIKDSITVR